MLMNNLAVAIAELTAANLGPVLIDEPLSRHNTWCIGGPAAVFVEPENAVQISRVVGIARSHAVPLVVVGQGSNLLFDDQGVAGIVMKIGAKMATVQITGDRITAAGGVWVPQLALASMRTGLSGLEHCIGIPGTLGGLVMMNGGSHRRGIGENIVTVDIVTRAGQRQTLSQEACEFSYRHSALQGSGCIVTGAELLCTPAKRNSIRLEMLSDLRERRRKFPRKQPNCGSVFLSTAEMHASVGPPGKIIEDAGLKGRRVGQAMVSTQHANFIVNLGGAAAADVLELIAQIRKAVRQSIGFDLCCEVRYVSPAGEILPAHLRAAELAG